MRQPGRCDGTRHNQGQGLQDAQLTGRQEASKRHGAFRVGCNRQRWPHNDRPGADRPLAAVDCHPPAAAGDHHTVGSSLEDPSTPPMCLHLTWSLGSTRLIAPRDIRAPCFLPLACWALMAGCYLRVAAPWRRGPIGPRLSAPVGQVLSWAPHSMCCTSWHTLQTSSTGGTSLKALPVLPPVPVQPLPRACR